MTISNWNPDLSIPPGTSKSSLDGYLCVPWAGGGGSTPVVLGNVFSAITGAVVLSSANGVTWASASAPTSGECDAINWIDPLSSWYGIQQGTPDTVVASTDGQTYSSPGSFAYSDYSAIVNIGTVLVAVGVTHACQSANGGATWSAQTALPISAAGVSVTSNGTTILCALTPGSNIAAAIYRSTDGTTWNIAGGPNLYLTEPHCVAYTGGLFAVAGNDPSNTFARISTSPDTVTWTVRNPPLISVSVVSTICGDGAGRWVVGCTDGSWAYSADDMASWSSSGTVAFGIYRVNYSQSLRLFVMVGKNSGSTLGLLVSSNPATGWASAATIPSGSTVIFDVGSKDP